MSNNELEQVLDNLDPLTFMLQGICTDGDCPCADEDKCCQTCDKINDCSDTCDFINYRRQCYDGNDFLIAKLEKYADEKDSWLLYVVAQRLKLMIRQNGQLELVRDAAKTVTNNAKAWFSRGYNGIQVDYYDVDPDTLIALKQTLAQADQAPICRSCNFLKGDMGIGIAGDTETAYFCYATNDLNKVNLQDKCYTGKWQPRRKEGMDGL